MNKLNDLVVCTYTYHLRFLKLFNFVVPEHSGAQVWWKGFISWTKNRPVNFKKI